jgi:DNA-binding transcriptional MerR regulator
MGYKIGVTTGLHYVARSEELATAVKKLGFGLTRGTTAIEIALDVPHEITETEGVEVRHIADKQGVDVLMHGSLTIPMGIPERSDWRDADDHIRKSIRSAVRAGAKYVDFHACLNIWLELMTYTSRKLTMSFCDHEGHFISRILKECKPLREWFVEKRGNDYMRDILKREEFTKMESEITLEIDRWYKEEQQKRLSEAGMPADAIERVLQTGMFPDLHAPPNIMQLSPEERARILKELEEKQKRGQKIVDEIRRERTIRSSEKQKEVIDRTLLDKLARGGEWDSEELRAVVGILDGYHIMAHYMFYNKDPLWVEMAKFYPALTEKYKMDYSNTNWLYEAWRKAEDENDRVFKEFFYGVVAAKYLEGHMKKTLEWRDKVLIPKELKGQPRLQQYARDLIMAIETPDARDAQHAGLHLLWSNRQIHVAVKVIRDKLKTNNVWMLADFEHTATQGVDPIKDMEEILKLAPDFGSICISCHANAPNPSHAHEPLELGDIRVYKLLYYLRRTGFGKGRDVFVIYERGGGDDPFKRSVETLRLMVEQLVKDTHPDRLPPEFFGYKGAVAGDEARQLQIVRDHTWEPLKDLLEMPEEEFTMLSSTVLKKGKRPEQWKKAEFR